MSRLLIPDSHRLRDRFRVCSGGIPTYANLVDMGAAIDDGDLDECDVAFVTSESGYYSVFAGEPRDVCLTPTGEGITVDNRFEVGYGALAAEGIFLLAQRPDFPWRKDWCGTVPDADWANHPLLEEEGLVTARSYKTSNIGQYAALELSGALSAKALFQAVHGNASPGISGAINICNYIGPGETIADNALWYFVLADGYIQALREIDGGDNHSVHYAIPGNIEDGEWYLIEWRVTSGGQLSCYLNGLQLQLFDNTLAQSGVSAYNDDGTADGWTTNGDGTDAYLGYSGIFDSIQLSGHFFHLFDTDAPSESPAEYASTKCVFDAAQLNDLMRDNFAAIAADPDAVISLRPDAAGVITDVVGTIPAWDANTKATTRVIGDTIWTDVGSGDRLESSNTALRILGDLTFNILVMAKDDTSTQFFCNWSNSGEASGDNYAYRFVIEASGDEFGYFAERLNGVNISCSWSIPTRMAKYEIREFRVTREDDGAGRHNLRCYMRHFGSTWTALEVLASSGSGVGTTTANVEQPTGADDPGCDFSTNTTGTSDFYWREMTFYSAAKDPTV